MAGKRGNLKKRSIPDDFGLPRERPKKRAKPAHPHGEVDYEQEYKVRSIIGETKTKYHVDWEANSDTGEVYTPTWEPKANANQLAIDDWEREKAARSKPPAEPEPVASSGDSAPPAPSKKSVSKKSRARKVIGSSSPAPEESATAPYQQSEAPAAAATTVEAGNPPAANEPEPESEVGESQQYQDSEVSIESSLLLSTRKPPTRKGFVVPSSPSSSYRAGQYQKFDSRPASRNGVESPHPASPITAATPVSSGLEVLQSTANEVEIEQAPSASVPGTSTQKSTASPVIPESQDQGVPEESTFRGFSPTQRREPRSPSQTGAVEASEGDSEQLAAEASQPLQTDRLSPIEARLSDCVSQAQSAVATPASPTEPDEQASLPGNNSLGHSQVDSNTQNTDQADSIAQAQSALGHSQVDANTQSTEQVDSIADTAVAQAQSSLTAISPPQDSDDRELIVISSTEHQSGQSASLNFESSVHVADYNPPPAGQRPLPSSPIRANSDDLVGRGATAQDESRICSPTGLIPSQDPPQPRNIHYYGPSQSSFPFQTQAQRPCTPQKIEPPADCSYTPGGRALIIPAQSPARSPSVLSTRAPDSTPFPSIPSHSLAIGESAPRPISFSPSARPSTMDSSQEKRETLAERMKRIRDERAAKRQSATPMPSVANGQPASALPPNLIAEVAVAQAARLGSPLLLHERSPSTVPAVEAVAPITREEMITSGRYETLLPQAHGGGSGEAESLQNGTSTGALSKSQDAIDNSDSHLKDPETASVHVVPVVPSAHQRDQYQNNVYYDQALIGEVLAAQALEGDLLTRASKFLQGLRDVAMHPDLVNSETLSQIAESDIQARWDIKCSAKFYFLNELISNLSDQNLHIAVAAHGQRIPDMLHKFLEGIKVPCKRWARPLSIDPDLSPANLGLKVSIIDLDGGPQNVEPADVVVAMDPSTDTEHPLIRAARKHAHVEGIVKWAMLLVLVIPRTVEHVERCVQAEMSHEIRTKVLVKATNELRWEAGRLESTQAPLVEAASAIADYMEDTSADWPIAGLSQLDELDSQTETDIQPDSNKRPLDETQAEDDNAVAKRARLSAPPSEGTQFPGTINPLDLDITHISDSLTKGTQSADAISSEKSVSATEQRLRELLQGVQDRLDEHVRALEALQYRHEDQRKELVEVRKERDGAILTAQTAASRTTGAEANNAALRIERTELKEALADANRRLLGHADPEVRELQEVRVQAEQARAEQEKALKKAAATEKDLDWTRSMYQDSSNRARELAQHNAELEIRLTHATQVARGEQARAREASFQGHNKLLEQENKRLKQMLENLKLAMRNKDEQISSLREGRGRIGTRQSSVPRSPRMGSPMKGGRLSRQTSPMASEARGRNGHLHPLRNSAGG